MRKTWEKVAAGSAMLVAGLSALYRFPPDRFPFYPACPFHAATGLLCPGCGSTRALAALLHGHLAEAWHWNALFVLLLPLALGYGALALRQTLRGLPIPALKHEATCALLGAALIFAVLRNG